MLHEFDQNELARLEKIFEELHLEDRTDLDSMLKLLSSYDTSRLRDHTARKINLIRAVAETLHVVADAIERIES